MADNTGSDLDDTEHLYYKNEEYSQFIKCVF